MCKVFLLLQVITLCKASAIPMWEYLSRDEKVSHLYSMFAQQVQQYCKSRTDVQHKPDCKRDLLMHGLHKLNAMDDNYIDRMDPYQRGANSLIWDSMMQGHPMMNSAKKPAQQSSTDSPIYQASGNFIRNPIFDEPAKRKPSFDPMDMELENQYLDSTPNHIQDSTNVHLQYLQPPPAEQEHYLTGPMVFRVHPDGTPVAEDKNKPLPKDDDRSDMTMGRERLPTMEEIMRSRVQRFAQSRFVERPRFVFRRFVY